MSTQTPPSLSDDTACLGIAEVALGTGLSAHTLRYYERDGLMLGPVHRGPTGRRLYRPADLRWLNIVTRLRATGMPIREVRRYAEMVREGPGNEAARLDLLRRHRERVIEQLAETTDHLEAIDAKIERYVEAVEAVDVSP